MATMRINKFLAHAGHGSRRSVDRLIARGLVKVNGEVVKTVGLQIDPDNDRVEVESHLVRQVSELRYVLLHKPEDVLSTRFDPEGRKTLLQLLPAKFQGLYPVGRLDQDSTGLVLLTNDGLLTHRMLHPKYHVPRVYVVKVWGKVTPKRIKELREGVVLQGKKTLPAQVTLLERNSKESYLEFVLEEGRHRQIRRMCGSLELEVLELKRVAIGPVELGDVKPGKWRELSDSEVKSLYEAVGLQ